MILHHVAIKRWVSRLLLISGLAGIAFLLARNPEQFVVLLNVDIWDVAVLLGITLASFLITGTVSWHLFRSLGASIPWSTNIALTLLSNLLNYLGPGQLGMGAKAIYLKASRDIRYANFAVVTGTNAMMMVLMAGIIGISLSVWDWLFGASRLQELGILSGGMVLTVSALVTSWAFFSARGERRNKWLRTLDDIIGGLNLLWSKHGAIFKNALLLALQYGVAAFALWYSYRALGTEMDYTVTLLIAAFLTIANIVPLTPNNVGVAELVIGAATELSGADFSTGIAAGVIMRVCHLLVCILSVPYSNWKLRDNWLSSSAA